MAKTLKTASELENLVLTKLRNNPDCAVITGVVVAPLDFPTSETNWDIAAVIRDGASGPPDADRALIAAKDNIRQHFDLLVDS